MNLKKLLFIVLLTLLKISHLLSADIRTVVELSQGWKFSRGNFPDASNVNFDDSGWQRLSIPHDWAIYGPFDKENDIQRVAISENGETIATEKTGRTGALPYIGVAWYRTSFNSPEKGKQSILIFDGAMSEAQVYINGHKVGYWPNGYNSFYFDITEYLQHNGKQNILAVRLENQSESSRWYPGAGLYRPVTLIHKNRQNIKTWGVRVTTPVIKEDFAKIRIKADFENVKEKDIQIVTIIKNQEGLIIDSLIWKGLLPPDEIYEADMLVKSPKLWSPESPSLYRMEVNLYLNSQLVDQDVAQFGIRSIEVNPKTGFVLNGQARKIKGVCLHHDLGPLGTALNKAALRRQIRILKDMGCDAIRTSHNIPSPWQMEICDEMGMMVMAESFDEWKHPKCKNGYNRFFDEWAEKDIVNMINRLGNHASIIMWSIGNEIHEQSSEGGNRIAKFLRDICKREDPTRFVTMGMNKIGDVLPSRVASLLDIPGLNYDTWGYQKFNDILPHGFVLGSETTSTVSSRGVYKYPVIEGKNIIYEDMQSSSYDWEACLWSNIPEDDWILQDDNDWVIGEFVWTGFDYLGEPTPYDEMWPSRSSYFGINDLAGIPKDRYYLYRSKWNPDKETLHLLPHWNWVGREGEITPVYCYTNFPSAELFLNGKSQGVRTKSKEYKKDRYRLRWDDVKYEKGEITVVAYDDQNKPKAKKTIRTAGEPYTIELQADRTELKTQEDDLSFITVSAVDKQGNPCPIADNLIHVNVRGVGYFQAICNGDATSLESFNFPQMKLFNGKLVIIINAGNIPGETTVKVFGKGLKSKELKLKTIKED